MTYFLSNLYLHTWLSAWEEVLTTHRIWFIDYHQEGLRHRAVKPRYQVSLLRFGSLEFFPRSRMPKTNLVYSVTCPFSVTPAWTINKLELVVFTLYESITGGEVTIRRRLPIPGIDQPFFFFFFFFSILYRLEEFFCSINHIARRLSQLLTYVFHAMYNILMWRVRAPTLVNSFNT